MMKRKMILGAAIAMACACTSEKGYQLECEVPEAWEGKQAVLYAIDNGAPAALDSMAVRKGHIAFDGHLEVARRCKVTVYLNPTDRHSYDMCPSFEVFLDSTRVQVRAEKGRKGMDFQIEGGASMTEWKDYLNQVERLSAERKELFDRYIEAFYQKELEEEGIQAALAVSRKAREIEAFRLAYVAAHPESMVSVQVLAEILDHAVELTGKDLMETFGTLSPAIRSTPQAATLSQAIQDRRIEVGAPCPDVQAEDADGQKHSLLECIRPGHYTLVEIWASWCAPCRGEIPFIRRAYERYHGKGLDIVSISINENRADWEKALEEEEMGWTQLLDSAQQSFQVFETHSVPTSLLIGPDGRIFKTQARGGWLDAALQDIYKQTI